MPGGRDRTRTTAADSSHRLFSQIRSWQTLSLLPFGSLMVMSPEEGVGLGLERGEDNEGGGKASSLRSGIDSSINFNYFQRFIHFQL